MASVCCSILVNKILIVCICIGTVWFYSTSPCPYRKYIHTLIKHLIGQWKQTHHAVTTYSHNKREAWTQHKGEDLITCYLKIIAKIQYYSITLSIESVCVWDFTTLWALFHLFLVSAHSVAHVFHTCNREIIIIGVKKSHDVQTAVALCEYLLFSLCICPLMRFDVELLSISWNPRIHLSLPSLIPEKENTHESSHFGARLHLLPSTQSVHRYNKRKAGLRFIYILYIYIYIYCIYIYIYPQVSTLRDTTHSVHRAEELNYRGAPSRRDIHVHSALDHVIEHVHRLHDVFILDKRNKKIELFQ